MRRGTVGKRTYSWSLLVACLMFVGTLAALSVPVSADSTLGGMDLDGYCRSLGYRGVTLTGHTVYDWYCVTNSGSHVGIEINKECNWQYHRNDAYAKYD